MRKKLNTVKTALLFLNKVSASKVLVQNDCLYFTEWLTPLIFFLYFLFEWKDFSSEQNTKMTCQLFVRFLTCTGIGKYVNF